MINPGRIEIRTLDEFFKYLNSQNYPRLPGSRQTSKHVDVREFYISKEFVERFYSRYEVNLGAEYRLFMTTGEPNSRAKPKILRDIERSPFVFDKRFGLPVARDRFGNKYYNYTHFLLLLSQNIDLQRFLDRELIGWYKVEDILKGSNANPRNPRTKNNEQNYLT